MKEYLKNILLIILTIIIIFTLIICIYKHISTLKNNNVENLVTEFPKNVKNNFETNSNNIIKNKEKIILDDNTNDSRLIQIVDLFNNSYSKEMEESGYTAYASVQSNKINVITNGAGLNYNIEYILNNDILSTKIDSGYSKEIMIKTIITIMIMDCTAQMKGYKQGDLIKNVSNAEELIGYTLEKEGMKLSETRK